VADVLSQDVLLAPNEASVIPLVHHTRALSRAVSGDRIRHPLADEVGLGRTIEPADEESRDAFWLCRDVSNLIGALRRSLERTTPW